MFQRFKKFSIKTKLTLLMMLISILLLLIVSVVVLVSEIYTSRTALEQELRVLSATLAANSREALVLGAYQETETLLGLLSTQRYIHAAYLFDRQGEPVAEYLSQDNARLVWRALEQDFHVDNRAHWESSTVEKLSYSRSHFGFFSPIFFDEVRVGTIYLLSDLNSLYGRLGAVSFGIILSLCLLLLCSWLLAGRLQKPISEPLLALAGLMEQISDSKIYSLRARKINDDEIGILVDGFNHMLEEVELHQQQQGRIQEHLEVMVGEKTAELQAAVRELKLARQQAESANEAKSLFLSRMTHELRTPLIGVLGMNELLLRTPLDEQQQALAETVRKSGEDLLALISDVLDLSRIEAGKLVLEAEDIELYRVVEEVAELLATQAQEKGLRLLVDIPLSATVRVKGDRAKIWQIAMNLIGNAIKFTSAGSVYVRLQVTRSVDGPALCVLEVEDTGIGMDAKVSRHIFDLFYQLRDPSSATSYGAGLGLPIVKQLVDLMGGTVKVSSTPASGSSFRVALPLPLVGSGQPYRPVQWPATPVAVALADTDAAGLLARQLTDHGMRVVTTPTAAALVQWLNRSAAAQANGRALFLCQELFHGAESAEQDRLHQLLAVPGLDVFFIVMDRHELLPLPAGVKRLRSPLTWGRLHEALLSRQASLAPPKIVPDAERIAEPRHGTVLFVGRHVAVRELLRLALARRRIALASITELSALAAAPCNEDWLLLIIDATDFSLAEVTAALGAVPFRLPACYLLGGDLTMPAQMAPLISGTLKKPLKDEELNNVLEPLLTKNEQVAESAAGGTA